MTRRRTIARLQRELSPAEAYAAFLKATARGDSEAAKDIVSTQPSTDVVLERSDLMAWHEAFADVVREFDREVQVALARCQVATTAHAAIRAQMEMTASLASQMYLSGVVTAAGETVSEANEAKASDISDAVLEATEGVTAKWEEMVATYRQRAADLVHAFDEVCHTSGVESDVIARTHALIEVNELHNLREVAPSTASTVWRDCFVMTLCRRLS